MFISRRDLYGIKNLGVFKVITSEIYFLASDQLQLQSSQQGNPSSGIINPFHSTKVAQQQPMIPDHGKFVNQVLIIISI